MARERYLTGALYAGLVATWQLQIGSPLGEGDGPRIGGPMERSAAKARGVGRRHLVRMTEGFLDALGPTPGAVAGSLYLAGVHGERGDPSWAPLAAFLAVMLMTEPGVRSVSVEPAIVTIVRQPRWRRPVTVPLPLPARTFAAAFEAGCYSLLARPQ